MTSRNPTSYTSSTPGPWIVCGLARWRRIERCCPAAGGEYQLVRVEVEAPIGDFDLTPGSQCPLEWSAGVSDAAVDEHIKAVLS